MKIFIPILLQQSYAIIVTTVYKNQLVRNIYPPEVILKDYFYVLYSCVFNNCVTSCYILIIAHLI